MLDHTAAYATFPNMGKAVTPHAILEVRTGTGDLVWRFDRDGPKPRQVMPPSVAGDMIKMMNSVVENGTGRRARLDDTPPQEKPARPTLIAMPGLSATRAILYAVSGSAMMTTR